MSGRQGSSNQTLCYLSLGLTLFGLAFSVALFIYGLHLHLAAPLPTWFRNLMSLFASLMFLGALSGIVGFATGRNRAVALLSIILGLAGLGILADLVFAI